MKFPDEVGLKPQKERVGVSQPSLDIELTLCLLDEDLLNLHVAFCIDGAYDVEAALQLVNLGL